MKYARLNENNKVIETFIPQKGFTIKESFHSDIAIQFIKVPIEVEQNWVKNPDGTFSAPIVEIPADASWLSI